MNFVEPSEKVQKIDQVLEGNSGQGGLNRKSALLWMQGSPAERTLRRGPTGHGHRSAESHFSGQPHLRGLGKHSLQNSLQLHLQKVAGSLQGDTRLQEPRLRRGRLPLLLVLRPLFSRACGGREPVWRDGSLPGAAGRAGAAHRPAPPTKGSDQWEAAGPGSTANGNRRAEARCPLRSGGARRRGTQRLGWRSVRASRHRVPAGELGVRRPRGVGRGVLPSGKRSSGAWGRRDAPRMARRFRQPSVLAPASRQRGPRDTATPSRPPRDCR
ncbi:hypothetical protein J1605_005035 [Eschrichtius robustus]|uniref:Uncharacterized protein n=1 Tax=Eschrichtius robustus TaxID=9764 RepID=A0AB34HAT3_ESCRO|nr:hypothetical protein J1605_005035 [Eschrichtius robustus]